MTVKRYWSRFKSYLLSHKIRINSLLTKQRDAVEKTQEIRNEQDKEDLGLALEAFKTDKKPRNT